jgi:type I restriction-modification system DNA methylase subunit
MYHTEEEVDIRIAALEKTVKTLVQEFNQNNSIENIDKAEECVKKMKKVKKDIKNLIAEIEVDDFLEYGSGLEVCPEPA